MKFEVWERGTLVGDQLEYVDGVERERLTRGEWIFADHQLPDDVVIARGKHHVRVKREYDSWVLEVPTLEVLYGILNRGVDVSFVEIRPAECLEGYPLLVFNQLSSLGCSGRFG